MSQRIYRKCHQCGSLTWFTLPSERASTGGEMAQCAYCEEKDIRDCLYEFQGMWWEIQPKP